VTDWVSSPSSLVKTLADHESHPAVTIENESGSLKAQIHTVAFYDPLEALDIHRLLEFDR
jgi:hypothetical protein